jgi:hypothetical protein
MGRRDLKLLMWWWWLRSREVERDGGRWIEDGKFVSGWKVQVVRSRASRAGARVVSEGSP